MASPPVIVNHSVVRTGTSARASAAGLAAYAGTRRGVVIEVSEADGRRLGVDGLAAYAANRTGSTGGLWGADGPVAVAEARRAIAQNGGAVLTTVVTVPNEIAPGAGLDRLDAWQALVRSEWPRLFSEMTGVPESRVEFYAAMHVNGTSHHVHILTVDREGGWDSLLPKGKMEAARLEISSKAMAPLLREAYIERDLAREAALDASSGPAGPPSPRGRQGTLKGEHHGNEEYAAVRGQPHGERDHGLRALCGEQDLLRPGPDRGGPAQPHPRPVRPEAAHPQKRRQADPVPPVCLPSQGVEASDRGRDP